MLLADQRVELDARPARLEPPLLEVAMLGHCPASDGAARWARLAGDEAVLGEMAALGFGESVALLKAMGRDSALVEALARDARIASLSKLQDSTATEVAIRGQLQSLGLKERFLRLFLPARVIDPGDQGRYLATLEQGPVSLAVRIRTVLDHRAILRLPVPIYSLAQFQALFPEAQDEPCLYRSELAGDRAWLPVAVQDFFEGDGIESADSKKLWVLRVPEEEGLQAFLPRPEGDPSRPETLGAFDRALLIPRLGVVVLPDLERLQVPADLPDIPRVRLDNPLPAFRPDCDPPDDTHRERRHPSEMRPPAARPSPEAVVLPLLRTLAARRPDVVLLLAAPLATTLEGEHPVPDPAFLQLLARIAGTPLAGGHGELSEKLRHLQVLFPYLRGAGCPLASPGGAVAGLQAAISHRKGPWRSIAGLPIPGLKLPYPPVSSFQATAWRRSPGLSVLVQQGTRAMLDDERLCVPCLPLVQLQTLDAAGRGLEHWRSAAVMRFLGWIRRELQRLGEGLLFDVDPRDPRPEMALRAFFTRLHAHGALRGLRPEDAFRLLARMEGESTLAFDIELTPAYPLDLIRITFSHDRHTGRTDALLEAAHG